MKALLSYFAALFSSLFLALESKFPVLSKRRAVSTGFMIVIIMIVAVIGAVIIYFIVTSAPSVTTTTTP